MGPSIRMTPSFVWQGFIVGFLAAVPLGPMGMVCVQRTLAYGRLSGLVSACGLALAAAFWCVVAAQGLRSVAELVAGHETIFTLALGVFLLVAGAAGLARGGCPVAPLPRDGVGSLVGQFTSCFLGVAFNPITFVTMTAVLAILGGVGTRLGLNGAIGLAGAAFAGGMSVWLCLTQGIALMRERLGEGGGVWISRTLNGCLLVLGVVYIVRPFLHDAVG